MISFTSHPEPTLVARGQTFRGINILQKLHDLADECEECKNLLQVVGKAFAQPGIPRIGFRLEHPDAVMPSKRIVDVGYDLTIIALTKQINDTTAMYETFVSLTIPLGYYVELIPRSSLSKTGFIMTNSIGIIDPCYTGTLKVCLTKVSNDCPKIVLPMRVAQLILKPYVFSYEYNDTGSKIETVRGSGGFGSTN